MHAVQDDSIQMNSVNPEEGSVMNDEATQLARMLKTMLKIHTLVMMESIMCHFHHQSLALLCGFTSFKRYCGYPPKTFIGKQAISCSLNIIA